MFSWGEERRSDGGNEKSHVVNHVMRGREEPVLWNRLWKGDKSDEGKNSSVDCLSGKSVVHNWGRNILYEINS